MSHGMLSIVAVVDELKPDPLIVTKTPPRNYKRNLLDIFQG